MQALYLKKNTKTFERSFYSHHAMVPYFYDIWHFHQELELNYIIQGSGTRFIGDHIEGFADGDMVLVGANLPHVWRNDKQYYELGSSRIAEAVFFHFLEDFAGPELFRLPEMEPVHKLLVKARQGVRITGETRAVIGQKMQAMLTLDSGEKLLGLLSILNLLAHSNDVEVLSSSGFTQTFQVTGNERINKVYEYTMNHFLEDIELDNIASIANMNSSAFCRFFKAQTKKTFVQFLSEIRLSYSCKLLSDDQLNIAQVCYECGFNNISNFNRKFKEFTGKTPQGYRNLHK